MREREKRLLDLCAGTKSSTRAFERRGWQVITLDNLAKHDPDLCMDVREFAKNPQIHLDRIALAKAWIKPGEHWVPTVIWASPPCTAFSMAGSGKGKVRWLHISKTPAFLAYVVKLRAAGMSPQQARAQAEAVHFDPLYGPRVPLLPESRLGVALVLACLEVVAKLKPRWWWMENPQGGLQTLGFMLAVPGGATITYCRYDDHDRMKPTVLWGIWPAAWKPRPRCYNGDPCHPRAPRGSRQGTQGRKDAHLRAMVPDALGEEIAAAVESEL
jgi:hypothetical protein